MPETDAPSLPTSSPDGGPAGAAMPAPAPATAPAPASTPAPASSTAAEIRQAAEASEAARERTENDQIASILAKHGLGKAPAAKPPQPQPPETEQTDDPTATADATADDSPADAHPALTLSDDDARMLERMGIEPDDLPDDPARRDAALARHRKVFERMAHLAAENGRLKKGTATGQAQTQPDPAALPQAQTQRTAPHPTSPPSDVETAWRSVDEVLADFGEDVTPRLRGAVESLVRTAIASVPAPDTSAQQQLWRRLEAEDFNRGLEAATFPDGVKKSDPKVRGQLLEETRRQYQAELLRRSAEGLPPPAIEEFNFEHAAQRAVPIVFAKQLQEQQKRAADDRRRKQLSGLPDAGATRSPTVKPNLDPEEADMENIRAHLKRHGLPVGA